MATRQTQTKAAGPKAGGYNPYNTLEIDFEGTRYTGARVKCRLDIPLSDLTRIGQELFQQADNGEAQALVFVREGLLLSWNLEDDSRQDIPVDEQGVQRAPLPFMKHVIEQWNAAVWDINVPLEPASTPG